SALSAEPSAGSNHAAGDCLARAGVAAVGGAGTDRVGAIAAPLGSRWLVTPAGAASRAGVTFGHGLFPGPVRPARVEAPATRRATGQAIPARRFMERN